ncbi:MAG: PKD domain-containing protein, partial [Bacteroidia bacterium]|nr:PKD domain-containing protein [Bacteroidia bacterium]
MKQGYHSYLQLFIFFLLIGFSSLVYSVNPSNGPRFIQNKGQWEKETFFRLNLHQGELFYQTSSVLINLHESPMEEVDLANGLHHHSYRQSIKGHAYRMRLMNANLVIPAGMEELPGFHNYLKGKDTQKWTSRVPAFAQITYENIYPGITWKFKGTESQLKYDFELEAGANPELIQINYEGVENLKIKSGKLIIQTSIGKVTELEPIAYQMVDGKRQQVACEFLLKGQTVSFIFPKGYRNDLPLVIDPTLVFATMTGAADDNFGFTATYDNAGNFYGGGIVFGVNYPYTTGAYQTTFGGEVDMSITKFSPNATSFVYSTLIGGNSCDQPSSLDINSQGQLVILGSSSSTDFPTTAGCFDNSFNGGVAVNFPSNGTNFTNGSDIVVSVLNPNGTALVGSTYFGGSGNDGINSATALNYNYGDQFRGEVVVDANDNIYIASSTQSVNFPVSAGAYQTSLSGTQDGVIAKFNSTLTNRIWGTYLGGTGTEGAYSLKLDANNAPIVCGGTSSTNFPTTSGVIHSTAMGGTADGWISHLNANGTALLGSSYLGTNFYDQAYCVGIDLTGDVYVTGQTLGNYPTTPGAFASANGQQFILKLNSGFSTTIAAAKFGTGGTQINISPTAFLVDVCERVYVAGWGGQVNGIATAGGTTTGLPVTANAIQSTTDGSDFYFFVLENNFATQLFGSFYGGNGTPEHVDGGTSRFDPSGVMYEAVCASCGSANGFPTTPGVIGPANGDPAGCNFGGIKISFEITDVNISLSASPSSSGCAPFNVNFSSNSNGADLYNWDFGDGSFSTSPSPSHTFTNPGTYTVTIIGTDTNACPGVIIRDTAYLSIIVTSGTVSAGLDQTVCNGSCVTLNASGATTYSWSPAAGLTGANTATPNACPVVTTSYVVTGTSNGCAGTDTVTVFVTTPPNVTAGNDTTICSGGTAQLFASGGLAYSWSPTNGLSNPNSSNPTASPSATTVYTVTVTAPSGNIVVNGDFSLGNSGFSSGYVNSNNLVPAGNYEVTTNAANNHPNFVGVDHTTGSGQFMAVNGSGTPNTDVWCQTVNVTPNTTYAFSTWVSTLAPGNPAALQFGINGTQLGSVFNAPSTTGTWSQFF